MSLSCVCCVQGLGCGDDGNSSGYDDLFEDHSTDTLRMHVSAQTSVLSGRDDGSAGDFDHLLVIPHDLSSGAVGDAVPQWH